LGIIIRDFIETEAAMNRISALLIIAAVAFCVAIFGSTPAGSTPSSGAPALTDSEMQQQVLAKEREGLDALKNGNSQRFADLTADDAVFVDAAGIADKGKVAQNVVGFTLTDYSIDDVKFVRVSPDGGLIAYKISEKGMSHGKEFSANVYVSAVWAERDGKWLCLFSQETSARSRPAGM
jgi:uncharacterized protein (TIGR02246 family)